jgi:hypothetical protein
MRLETSLFAGISCGCRTRSKLAVVAGYRLIPADTGGVWNKRGGRGPQPRVVMGCFRGAAEPDV